MLKLTIIGNLGSDAEQHTSGDKTTIKFNVAHNEHFRDKEGNPKTETQWVNVNWETKVNLLSYLKKGSIVHVEGRLKVVAKDNKVYWNLYAKQVDLISSPKQVE